MKYQASCRISGRKKYLGNFDCPTQAFQAYKEAKESYAKELATEWAGKVDARVVEALNTYTVTITD